MKKYRDHYFLKAKRENYPARSIYKLREMDARFGFLRPGLKVLDLGAAPGSWTLGAAEKVGAGGRVLACDIQDTTTQFPAWVTYLREDVLAPSETLLRVLAEMGPFDLVLSDMAPSTTGSKFTDQARSFELAMAALERARTCLVRGGGFVVKVFMGPDVEELRAAMREAFTAVKTFKPQSSRAESMETFLVGLQARLDPASASLGMQEGAGVAPPREEGR
ncbi:MAG: RlmE family RNA methyltransferase [Desulfovibrio sp.]|nr:RlmE family RNA methyltransferase [Desulfovibrio sp.]